MEKLLIAGAGAHSKVVLDIAIASGLYEVVGLIDHGEGSVLGVPIIGDDENLDEVFNRESLMVLWP